MLPISVDQVVVIESAWASTSNRSQPCSSHSSDKRMNRCTASSIWCSNSQYSSAFSSLPLRAPWTPRDPHRPVAPRRRPLQSYRRRDQAAQQPERYRSPGNVHGSGFVQLLVLVRGIGYATTNALRARRILRRGLDTRTVSRFRQDLVHISVTYLRSGIGMVWVIVDEEVVRPTRKKGPGPGGGTRSYTGTI